MKNLSKSVVDFVRKLTSKECERLQTVPDNYTDCVSDTHRYKKLDKFFTHNYN